MGAGSGHGVAAATDLVGKASIPVVGIPMPGTGHLADLLAGRELIRRSFDFRIYAPQDTAAWDAAYAKFRKLLGQPGT